ncbi:hypothetical protein F5Y14DRAFT_414486 [Nemania sp. NC0429]|nr:hypothetical protein F5Y14DRAFT_414486 [Nemania sp. NC0429]
MKPCLPPYVVFFSLPPPSLSRLHTCTILLASLFPLSIFRSFWCFWTSILAQILNATLHRRHLNLSYTHPVSLV